jgi:hypothetical protein
MTNHITVRVGDPVAEAAPELWGLFIEDLNDALDGGLNAELVRNGDFEFDPSEREGFTHLTGWTTEGAVAVRTASPLHLNNRHYTSLTGPAAIANSGWYGIRATAGEPLRLTLFARAMEPTRLTVTIGAGLASVELDVAPGGWRYLEADLTPTATGCGELRIAVPVGADADLDAVSLRPLGESGEPLTFRPDLLQALKDLHPSFIRFPGGCLAHGFGLDNMYHWKDTIGPRWKRAQARNIWGYHQSRQIGYGEYFALCEAVGATAIPIVAAGVCCQNSPGGQHAIPESDMDAYVQDVLDLIEFANGGTETRWGAVRARLGHPEPHGLRYLGLGNEDQITEEFRDRYARIEDALTKAHPEITVIGTSGPFTSGPDFEAGWAYARERGTAMVDEHGYQSPRWFHQNLDRYAAYDPDGPKVYLGEYAGCSSTVRSALAEAAYMIGLERNPDTVRLASYAPLLARVGHTQWTPDLIYFTADEVRPSASYYVQRAFGSTRGERVHAVELEGAEPWTRPTPAVVEAHVSSPRAAIAFSDLVIDGHPMPGQTTAPGDGGAVLGAIDPTAADVEFTAVRRDGEDGFALRLGQDDPLSSVKFHFCMGGNRNTAVVRRDDGIDNWEGAHPWPEWGDGVPVRVRVRLEGPRVRIWVDDEFLHDLELDTRPEHRVVAGALSRTEADGNEYVIRLVNAEETEKAVRLDLGAVLGAVAADIELLAGAGPDEGALFEVSPVLPVRESAKGENGIDLALPPWSFASAVIRPAA